MIVGVVDQASQKSSSESNHSVLAVGVSDVNLSNPGDFAKIMLPLVSAMGICAYPDAPTVLSRVRYGTKPINSPTGASGIHFAHPFFLRSLLLSLFFLSVSLLPASDSTRRSHQS